MKNVFKISASILLFISLAGCGAKQSLENKEPEQKYEAIEGPGKDFDWNAKVSPFDTKQTYEKESGQENTSKSAAVPSTQNILESRGKKITDKKVQEALKVVDSFYVNQENIDILVKAAGYNNQHDMYKKAWEELKKTYTVLNKDVNFTYQDINYNMNEYGPMALKVNNNAYGKTRWYTLNDYVVNTNTVYLSISVPNIDSYQYYLKASKKSNYKSFIEPLIEINKTSDSAANRIYAKLIFYLATVDFKGDGYVDLIGNNTDLNLRNNTDLYLVIRVDDSGNAKIDTENLLNLLRIDIGVVNENNREKLRDLKFKIESSEQNSQQ